MSKSKSNPRSKKRARAKHPAPATKRPADPPRGRVGLLELKAAHARSRRLASDYEALTGRRGPWSQGEWDEVCGRHDVPEYIVARGPEAIIDWVRGALSRTPPHGATDAGGAGAEGAEARTSPTAADLAMAAGISDDTFARVRRDAGIVVMERGAAARRRRYSPVEVDRLRRAAREGNRVERVGMDQKWAKWGLQRPQVSRK